VESSQKRQDRVPKVRQKAVVKFSRTAQSYTVQYDEYDGGGAIPGVTSVATENNSQRSKSEPGQEVVP